MIAMKKHLRLIGSFLAIAILFSSCLKDNDYQPLPNGLVSFINAYPDAHAITYTLSSNKVTTQEYKSYTLPIRVFPGNRDLRVYSHNNNSGEYEKKIIDTTITVKDSTGYSAFTYGSKEDPVFAMVKDQSIKDLNQKSGTRFFNFANNVTKVNLFFGDDTDATYSARPIETPTSASANESFKATKSGKLKLQVTDETGKTIATRENYTFKEGLYYTVFLSGTKDADKNGLYIGVLPH